MSILPNVNADLGIIFELHGKSVTHRSIAEALDSYGQVTGATNTDVTITAVIVPIKSLEFEQQDVGWIDTQNLALFVKGSVGLAIRDEIIDGTAKYVVRSIKDHGFFSQSDYVTVAEVERND